MKLGINSDFPQVIVGHRVKGHSKLYIDHQTLKQWGLRSGDKNVIEIGSACRFKADVVVQDSLTAPMSLSLGNDVRFGLPTNLCMKISMDSMTKRIKIGPIVGILTNNTKINPADEHKRKKLFGSQAGTFKDLMKVGRRKSTMVYIFTPYDIAWSEGIVHGYYYMPIKGGGYKWVRRAFPLPDVVYNRVPSRSDEAKQAVVTVKRRLMATQGLEMFNAQFLDKWQVHKSLCIRPELSDNVIDTAKFHGSANVMSLLKKHGQVFMKPVADSLGNGAMRIKRVPQGFTWELNIPGRGTKRKIMTSSEVLKGLVSRATRHKPYLVQKCVNLARYRGRPFDVRALVQKDEEGKWKLTGMAARIAQKDRITTHIPNGGYAQSLPRTLKEVFSGTDVEAILVEQKVSEAAVLAAQAVDSNCKGNFGEMSLDVGIDSTGHVWIFEVNSKPFRFDEEKIRQVALRRIIGYSNYLAGFVYDSDDNLAEVEI